ncbi:MAG: hypothetical protein KJ072_21715 [Verrucomicrobia bacterium]|nr:hypothetical protein [Verrucomicrobiota bacterium]
MTNRILYTKGAVSAFVVLAALSAQAQIDPEPRQLLHLGLNQSLHDDGPGAAYAFFYWNMPNVPSTNQTLRLTIAPVYVDSELAFKALLGDNTDLGVGLFGGAFANRYEEVRQGDYLRDESFDGHGGGVNVSLYHLFNPTAPIPLNGLLRVGADYRAFEDTDDTGDTFELPDNQPFLHLRAGFRWGGSEPVLRPRLAMEVSAWYELEHRTAGGRYGFTDDRELEPTAHRFLGRAQLNWTLPESEHYIWIGLMGGSVIGADRLSAYRLGGALPFTSEFPLYIPGYFYQELSTENFGLVYGSYSIPFGASKQWNVTIGAATALVDYVDGLEQPGNWHSGFNGGFGYTAKERRWRVLTAYGYGVDAIRSDGRGGHNVALIFQYNFGHTTFASDRAFEALIGARAPARGALRR